MTFRRASEALTLSLNQALELHGEREREARTLLPCTTRRISSHPFQVFGGRATPFHSKTHAHKEKHPFDRSAYFKVIFYTWGCGSVGPRFFPPLAVAPSGPTHHLLFFCVFHAPITLLGNREGFLSAKYKKKCIFLTLWFLKILWLCEIIWMAGWFAYRWLWRFWDFYKDFTMLWIMTRKTLLSACKFDTNWVFNSCEKDTSHFFVTTKISKFKTFWMVPVGRSNFHTCHKFYWLKIVILNFEL